MSPQNDAANCVVDAPAFVAMQEQLQIIAQQLRAGLDVAPSQRLQLEGFVSALIASGANIDALEKQCAAIATDVITVVREGDGLRFDCWQQRAPVFPSTK